MVLTGFRFSPTDEELLDILNQKVSGNTAMTPLDFIVESNFYELEPKDLQLYMLRAGTQSVALNKNERYYYCKRKSDSRDVSGRGWWKATSHVKTISADDGREWRLCKIMYKGKAKLKEDMENIINTNPISLEAEVSSSSINPMQLDFTFEEPWRPPLPATNE
ncbi:hypothetical protein DITRI_Ditri15bG0041200 [Diplodiscus trichospermus]